MIRSLDAADRVFTIIDANQAAATSAAAAAAVDRENQISRLQIDAARHAFPSLEQQHRPRGALTLHNVTFAYKTRPTVRVLPNVSLSIEPSCLSAIVGKSGIGKSTLLKVISGLYTPQAGVIMLDGVDIQTVGTRWLRSQVAVVEQSANLLSGSIRSNIVYGMGADTRLVEDTDETTEFIEAAAKLSGAHDFITDLPEGYATHVGPRGSLLSGGQQARIAIARALVRRPALLPLDEATAGLDPETELEVLGLLKNLTRQQVCSVVFFTHSETVLKSCDMVYSFSDGQLAPRQMEEASPPVEA